MIRLDKVKQIIPINEVDINADLFEAKRLNKNNRLVYELKENTPKPLGISYIEYDDYEVKIEYSGKVLKSNYYDLIHFNNVDLIVSALEDANMMSLKVDSLLSSPVIKTDNTQNIHVGKLDSKLAQNPLDCVNLLTMIPKQQKYTIMTHTAPTNIGIDIKKQLKKGSRRLIGYGKRVELEHKNDRVLDYINIEDFNDVIRFEASTNTFKQIRDYYDVKDLSLGSILQAKNRPLDTYFKDYTKSIDKMKTTNINSDIKYAQIQKLVFIRTTLNEHNNNLDSIRAWLLYNNYCHRSNISRYMKQFESVLLNDEQYKMGSDLKEYKALINSIGNELRYK